MSKPSLSITFRIDRFVHVLFVCLVFFVLAHIVTQTACFTTGHSSIFGLVELFNVDRENNIPTAFGLFILIIAIRTLANAFVKRCDNIQIAVRASAGADAPRLTP